MLPANGVASRETNEAELKPCIGTHVCVCLRQGNIREFVRIVLCRIIHDSWIYYNRFNVFSEIMNVN